MHDLVAGRLELLEQFRNGFGGVLLEVVHQHDAFAVLVELGQDRLDDALRRAHREVERIHVGRPDADIALAHIGDELRRVTQRREAEERRGRSADGGLHGADAFFDFGLRVFDAHAFLRQVDMAPCMRADRVAGLGDLPEDFRVVACVLADREEKRLGAVIGEGFKNARRIVRPRAVVEGQHHFLVSQEIVLAEMLEAETRAAGGVDLDGTRDSDRVRIRASCLLCECRARSRHGRGSDDCACEKRTHGDLPL